jgi:hypothetical protein
MVKLTEKSEPADVTSSVEIKNSIHAIRMYPPEVFEKDGEDHYRIFYMSTDSKRRSVECSKALFKKVDGNPNAVGSGLHLLHYAQFLIGCDEEGKGVRLDTLHMSPPRSPGVRIEEEEATDGILRFKLDPLVGGFEVDQIPSGMAFARVQDIIKMLNKHDEIAPGLELDPPYMVENVRKPYFYVTYPTRRNRE